MTPSFTTSADVDRILQPPQREHRDAAPTPLPKCACGECKRGDAVVKPNVRTFASGATRDTDQDKLDFDGFLSPHALRAFGQYMHRHRQQSDGQLRDSDNWQKGIPREQLRKSAFRHFLAWWELHRAGRDCTEEACALLFNLMADLHESLKTVS